MKNTLIHFALLLLSLSASAQRVGKDYAVFFYVTDFKPRWAPLPETKKESLELKKELETNFNFTCEAIENPTKQTILDKISAYNDLLTPSDQVMFFFSMHGHFEEIADRGYLVATDGVEIDKYGSTYLSYDDLNAYLALCKAKHVLLALDACHSGAFGIRNKAHPDQPAFNQSEDCTKRVERTLQYSGRQYCSSGNKLAKTPAKSQFASRLLEALRNGGDNGLVRFADLEYYLSKVEYPKPESGSFKGHEPGGDFVFLRKNSCLQTKDQDGDGILDADDKCPNDFGSKANNGCPEKGSVSANADSDYDGVPNTEDKCPDKFGTKANSGCPEAGVGNDIADADLDGVPDDRDACPTEYGIAKANGCPDRDNDGVPDKSDKCKAVAGAPKWQGCPDSDGDGLPDHEDDCPHEKGLQEEKGCPLADSDQDGVPDKSDLCKDKRGELKWQGCPDSDGDGLPDNEDKCPNQKGLFSDKGCPPPDRDGDGIPDKSDKCPDVAGEAYLEGCAETGNTIQNNNTTDNTGLSDKSTVGTKSEGLGSVLFTVAKTPIHASYFSYIYKKTNQDKADYSEKSLRDYLDLYINHQLKVQEARDMRLDTISSLASELSGYQKQLAKSYLEDREVTDKLTREVYDRMKQDVEVSHILISCAKDAVAADTLKAYNRASDLLKTVKTGKSFEQTASDFSEDKSSRENKGNLGFITAMLPDGYYNLENAIYSAKPGSLLGPIRSSAGYHIVKVNSFRPARGEVEASQILIRKSDDVNKANKAKQRIDSLYSLLQSGQKWDDLCTRFSDDKASASKGGYIGFFGINRYQKSFEDAAFALSRDGDYSKPVETSIGWHIILRKSRRSIGTYDELKRSITEKVKRDSRSELAKQAIIAKIKRESNYTEYPKALATWSTQQIDTIFHTLRWKPNPAKPQTVLCRFGQDKAYTVADFEAYCESASRDRLRGAGYPVRETINKLYKYWSDDVTIAFEEAQLGKKYPEFNSLMREYEDGVLLFEALKLTVWDRANNDTIGLTQFFNRELQGKYKWDERAVVSIYTLKTDDPNQLQKVREFCANKSSAEVLKKFNKQTEVVTVEERRYEKGKNKDADDNWKAGKVSSKTDNLSGKASFIKVEQIIPPTPKNLVEARGYAVADYQDYLEKKWVDELRRKYKVVVNEEVLKSLIKK